MAISDVNTAVTAATAAIDAGDWATAETELMKAGTYLAAVPDSKLGSGTSELMYDRQAIAGMLKQVRMNRQAAAHATAGGPRTTKLKFVRADTDDEC